MLLRVATGYSWRFHVPRATMEGYMPVVAVFLLLFGSSQTVAPSLPPLRGVVRDQTGAVLQGARVELADEAGAVLRTVSTDARGEFSIDGLSPGAYVLKVQFEGFRASAIRLRVAPRRAPPPQTIVLDLASQTQEVTVTADTDLITAAANANRDAVVLDEKELKNLPIFDRDIVGTLSRLSIIHICRCRRI